MKLFHWGLMLRYMVYGVLPLLLLFALLQRFGSGDIGVLILILAATLPFIAVGWLGYQHFRHRVKAPARPAPPATSPPPPNRE